MSEFHPDTEVDLKFAEIGYELSVVEECVQLLQHHLPTLIEGEKHSAGQRWADDPATLHHLIDLLEAGLTTRFLTAATLVATWAVYESAVNRIAEYIAEQRGVTLKINQVRGDFLQRVRAYYKDVLKYELHREGTDWDRLDHVATLRNALAHTNGVLADVREPDARALKKWIPNQSGISIVDDEYVVVSLDFVEDSITFLAPLLDDLIARVKKDF
jgi:hypothetical protein